MLNISLKAIIGPAFYDLHKFIRDNKYTHFWLGGGRGSLKSSFCGIEIPLGMMKDPKANAVVLRKVGETLADSVYAQLMWGIEMLGVSDKWEFKTSPLKIIYKPTGQEILFRSANNKDDYRKIKSTKAKKGYFKFIWYEEVDEFNGISDIRNINQSLMRGGDNFVVLYSYNPPKSKNNWVNAEALVVREDKILHKSTYLEAPSEWLGKNFFIEAEHLKKTNELAYRNEYLGEATGTGGAVFNNLNIREITREELGIFDNILDGIDFGYAVDPLCYGQMHFDRTRRRLYIFNELYKVGMSNRALAEAIKRIRICINYITCDSAEPKSIDELRSRGLNTLGAKKGPDSISYGIKFLQDLEEIVIDPVRCPNIAREFDGYEYDKDKYGNFISRYPDINNHSIDMTRYALEKYTINKNLIYGYGKI